MAYYLEKLEVFRSKNTFEDMKRGIFQMLGVSAFWCRFLILCGYESQKVFFSLSDIMDLRDQSSAMCAIMLGGGEVQQQFDGLLGILVYAERSSFSQ